MRIYLFLLPALLVLFYSCETSINRGPKDAVQQAAKYTSDTSSINKSIRNVSQNQSLAEDSGFSIIQKARQKSIDINYQKGIGESFFQEGVLFYKMNQYTGALESFNQALQIAEVNADYLLKARCLERMASVTLSTGDDHRALKLYYEALPLFEQVANKEGIAKVYNIIGLYKSAQKEYDSSEMYYRRAIRLNEEINNQTGVVHNKGNLGYLYENTGEYEKAKKLYYELVGLLADKGDSVNLPVIYYNFSSLFEKQNQPDSTLKYLRLAIRIAEKQKDTSLLTSLYGNYGDIMISRNNPDSAYVFLEKSAKYAHAIGDAYNELDALQLLFSLDTLSRKHKNAVSRFGQILAMKDTVYQRKIKYNLKASELHYENQRKDNQIELQKTQLQAANKQKQIYILLFLFSLISGVLLLSVIFLIIKNNRKKRKILDEELEIKEILLENAEKAKELDKLRIWKAEEEIRMKEQEQMSNALALEQKNELLGMINSKIVEAMKDSGIIKISELNGIVASIKAQLVDSTENDLFNQKFNQLHKSFYDNIKESHPDLSKSELKFCAYLKLNLSGSQIAQIQNVSIEAIRKIRYRIRKKFQLAREESLEDYISRF